MIRSLLQKNFRRTEDGSPFFRAVFQDGSGKVEVVQIHFPPYASVDVGEEPEEVDTTPQYPGAERVEFDFPPGLAGEVVVSGIQVFVPGTVAQIGEFSGDMRLEMSRYSSGVNVVLWMHSI